MASDLPRGDAAIDPVDLALARLVAAEGPDGACATLSAAGQDRVLARARYHGVLPLIAARIDQHDLNVPAWLGEAARSAARAEVALDLVRRPLIAEACAALERIGAEPVVLKGEAVAHTHYDAAWQRPRSDTDLLVAPDAGPAAEAALLAIGYRPLLRLPGRWVSTQSSLVRAMPGGIEHVIDLHWRINNSWVLAGLINHREIADKAFPLQALGASARGPCPLHALLIACLHRVGSQYAPFTVDRMTRLGGDRLIWLADIDRFLRGLGPAGVDALVDFVRARGAGRLVAAGVLAAAARFGTPGAPATVAALLADASRSPVSRYVDAGPFERAWLDFWALPGARSRLAFVRETLWPAPEYMLATAPAASGRSITLLRLRRLAMGILARWRGT